MVFKSIGCEPCASGKSLAMSVSNARMPTISSSSDGLKCSPIKAQLDRAEIGNDG